MIDRIVELYRAVHREVPEATVDEITTAMLDSPSSPASELAMAIRAARTENDAYWRDFCERGGS
jgi:hypothetical protein